MSNREFSMSLSVAERAQFDAAQSMLAQGNWRAAAGEVKRMRPATRTNRDVLRLRFRLCSAAGDWETALTIAEALISDESDAEAWVFRSDALHALKRTAEAEALLRPALERFPGVGAIEESLARYASDLQKRADSAR